MPFFPMRDFRGHRHIDRHAEIAVGGADKATGDGDCLTDVTGDDDAYQDSDFAADTRWAAASLSCAVCRSAGSTVTISTEDA